MSEAWRAWSYGEQRDPEQGRSLGSRLLAGEALPEAEALAQFCRDLQTLDWPADWPTADTFCTLPLGKHQRAYALVRFGLLDHTSTRRPGSLEAVGLVGPDTLPPAAVLATRDWLAGRRATLDDLAAFSGSHGRDEIAPESAAPRHLIVVTPRPSLPAFEQSALLLPAADTHEPDRRFEQEVEKLPPDYHWLAWVGPEFPLARYLARGPVVAFTVQPVDHRWRVLMPQQPSAPIPGRGRWLFPVALGAALVAVNALGYWSLDQRLRRLPTESPAPPAIVHPAPEVSPRPDHASADDRAVLKLVMDQQALKEPRRKEWLEAYEGLVRSQPAWASEHEARRLWLGALCDGSHRATPAQVEQLIRAVAEQSRGIDPEVVQLIAHRVYEKLSAK